MNENTQEMVPNSLELPLYNCHKQVRALKISKTVDNPNKSIDIFFEDGNYAPINQEVDKKPTPEAGWYYVVYKDGYTSFSPAEAFEDGYSLAE